MSTQKLSRSRPTPTVCIIGGAVMGLTAAIELAHLAYQLGVSLTIRLFEASRFGGGTDDRSTSPRCQLWWHKLGTIYAPLQPAVSVDLQRSAQRLWRLARHAFVRPLALAIEPPDKGADAAECFRALGIWHRLLPPEVVRQWFPSLRFPENVRFYRTKDGAMNLPLLGDALSRHAKRRGVEFVHRRVDSLDVVGDRICSLTLQGGNKVPVRECDTVILACGARIRPLLGKSGLVVPGLRLFRSHLVATDAFGIPALLAYLHGGVNCVPHELPDGRLINIFGDAGRTELPPESDGRPLRDDPGAVRQLCRHVEEGFGLQIAADHMSWPAVKTEIVHDGIRSQAHHTQLIPGLKNAWIAIPGKLSQSAACAQTLACHIVWQYFAEDIARPVWERMGGSAALAKAS